MATDTNTFSAYIEIANETLEDIVIFSLIRLIETIPTFTGKTFHQIDIDTETSWVANQYHIDAP